MKKDKTKTLVIILLTLIIIYLVLKYVIPLIFAYVIILLAFIPPLFRTVVGLFILVLIFYLIYKVLRKK